MSKKTALCDSDKPSKVMHCSGNDFSSAWPDINLLKSLYALQMCKSDVSLADVRRSSLCVRETVAMIWSAKVFKSPLALFLGIKICSGATEISVWVFPTQLEIKLPQDPSVSILSILRQNWAYYLRKMSTLLCSIVELMTSQEKKFTEVDEWIKRTRKRKTLQWYIIQPLVVIPIPIIWKNI